MNVVYVNKGTNVVIKGDAPAISDDPVADAKAVAEALKALGKQIEQHPGGEIDVDEEFDEELEAVPLDRHLYRDARGQLFYEGRPIKVVNPWVEPVPAPEPEAAQQPAQPSDAEATAASQEEADDSSRSGRRHRT